MLSGDRRFRISQKNPANGGSEELQANQHWGNMLILARKYRLILSEDLRNWTPIH